MTERAGPVVVGYDGTDAAGAAIREAGALFSGRPALVLTVWKEGIGFELEAPVAPDMPLAPINVEAAFEIDDASRERAQRTAERGAQIAREAGFGDVEALAVADNADRSVAETISNAAAEKDAQAIVVGAHKQGRLSEVVLGSTSRDVVRRAKAPVVVVRETD